MSARTSESDLSLPHTLGHYTLRSVLGRGGMGVVYAARDDRLGRDVAVKMISGIGDDVAVKRFWREARAAASVSHPHVCQIYDVDEGATGLYLAMELLVGESLETRLTSGTLSPRDAIRVAAEVLSALGALHERGFVHRDVKPSNIFLTAHGAKLLDFGLTRPGTDETLRIDAMETGVTMPGAIVGTPRYMAPEQIRGEALDGRTDLYALGAVLFEMLAGRSPFVADNLFDLLFVALHELPPALKGPPDVVAIDRVIRRALAKDASARHASAAAMREELRAIALSDTTEGAVAVRALVRVIVLPLRLARPDEEIAFLSFGLADAIAGALAPLDDLVVRSSALGARWVSEQPDFRKVAVEADVDLVLSGTLLRSGDLLRVTVQLIDAISGTVAGAATVNKNVNDVFALEDALVHAATQLLEPRRSSARSQRVARRDVPASALAFESFLRAVELARNLDGLALARVLYQRAVDEDPTFAPAWAGLGRCLRVAAKYDGEGGAAAKAEEAFRRALALNPDLPAAHQYLTHLESEQGQADAAISRLLEQAKRNRNDAQNFAGLVHACRYGGLLDASVAAHEEARRLDPTIRTSFEYTLLVLGDFERMDGMMASMNMTADPLPHAFSLMLRNRCDEGLSLVRRLEATTYPAVYRLGVQLARELLQGEREAALASLARITAAFRDPEALFVYGILFAQLGVRDRALKLMTDAVDGGYAPVRALESQALLAAVASLPGFDAVLEKARRRQLMSQAVFERAGGPALLGVH